MKILWLCNIMLPKIADDLSLPVNNFGGWLSGLSNDLIEQKDIELTICFPIKFQREILEGKIADFDYFGFPEYKKEFATHNIKMENNFKKIIEKSNPDVIHIYGTEFFHTLSMVNVCNKLGILNKVVISIQGLISVYALHYFASLPVSVIKSYTMRDLLRRNNINAACKDMKKRGHFEVEALKIVKNIIGRTTFDKACTSQINPNSKYYFCNESLRDEFYKNVWSFDNCEQFSIFTSQASYPIKGVHFMLEAMPIVLRFFPKAKLYIAGYDITKADTLKESFKRSSYAKYIIKLIKLNDLWDRVHFTGVLNEKEMCERYLKSNVFVCPSSIENSPNSLGEAMLLGVPSVASNVGGVSDMLVHNTEGFIYQADAPYMLAHYICEIFKNEEIASELSLRARHHALVTHDRRKNTTRLLEIYNDILKKQTPKY